MFYHYTELGVQQDQIQEAMRVQGTHTTSATSCIGIHEPMLVTCESIDKFRNDGMGMGGTIFFSHDAVDFVTVSV